MANDQINQYTITASEIKEDDWFDMDQYVSPGVYQSARVPGSLMSFTDKVDITYLDLYAFVTSNAVTKNRMYYITDRDIVVRGLDGDVLSSEGSRIMRVVKPTYYVISGINKGVWNSGLSVSIGDVVVYGGKAWTNLTGAIGSPLSLDDLDVTNWELKTTDLDTYYKDKSFFVIYDFLNDFVSEQHDNRGNSIYQTATGNIERTDWGNENIYQNVCGGIFNNSNDDTIAYNKMSLNVTIRGNSNTGVINNNYGSGSIYNNTNTGDITGNRGGINSNSNTGSIIANYVKGSISSNSNAGDIESNTNNGSIASNANNGYISFNLNNGDINFIGAANDDIGYNINNGSISTTTTGDITDTIVNK